LKLIDEVLKKTKKEFLFNGLIRETSI